MPTAIDCQSFAGTFALAAHDAGFDLVGKREGAGGFGLPLYRGNLDLLGVDPATIQTTDPAGWEPVEADLVFGNPPCSGFSMLSTCVYQADGSIYRGVDSPANDGMREFVAYAARVKPTVAIFESVTGAFKQGRELMRMLRDQLEEQAGRPFELYHVLHDNLALGGYARRKRYFFVASQVPFGVQHPVLERTGTLRDAIGDLEDHPEDPEFGHVVVNVPRAKRLAELAAKTPEWNGGEVSGIAWQRAMDAGVTLDTWNPDKPGVDSRTHMYAARRWAYDEPARVLRQYASSENVHPVLPRCFTYREAARIMGLPDRWNVQPAVQAGRTGESWFGKGIPYGSGYWIADAARRAIEGDPYPNMGDPAGHRENVIDCTKPILQDAGQGVLL